jgi:hypothetical protein
VHREPLRGLGYRVTRALSALASAIGLSLGCTGCGTAILARYDAIALALPAESAFHPGSRRDAIEAKLGKPDASRALPDGSRADTYTYTLRNPQWAAMKWAMAVGTVISVGFTEPIWVPWASYDVVKHRRTVTFRYDADDVLSLLGVRRQAPCHLGHRVTTLSDSFTGLARPQARKSIGPSGGHRPRV